MQPTAMSYLYGPENEKKGKTLRCVSWVKMELAIFASISETARLPGQPVLLGLSLCLYGLSLCPYGLSLWAFPMVQAVPVGCQTSYLCVTAHPTYFRESP